MPALWGNFFSDLVDHFRVADFFDIAIITLFIYSMITWVKQTASRSIFVGASVVVTVYFLARTFDLYLTSLLFQAVFAVLLIALVVVFQEDLRRLFERIALWGTFRGKRRAVAAHPRIDNLIEAVSVLASRRIGALLVLKGKEPLERHIDGGVVLEGRLSKPLLYSLFDTHSPGHDGAMLVEGEQIVKFGAHLPLSKNLREVGTRGTRHTAALGLSERCDALVVVVSEENGTISIAEGGRLDVMESAAELKGRLEGFFKQRFPKGREGDWKTFFQQDARVKVASVLLASLAWFLFAYQSETIHRTFIVPIEYRNLPKDWRLEWTRPSEVRVTLSGSDRAFQLFNPSTLILSMDLAGVQEGPQQLVVQEEAVRIPANLSVYQIDPSVVSLEARPVTIVRLPVLAQTVGEFRQGVRLIGIQVAPQQVHARIPKGYPNPLETLATQPVDVSQITETTTREVPLIIPDFVRLVETEPTAVRVTVEVERK
ncbi:MAG: hypothetical protein COV76_06295 [Candidatus Omnitrophica bacterium CG11_big_fil_rev_8_21_14_0_20_64_10]|nr:MAG: hypothetical protein COV76_06295 [Candidatus Omnitrophica bacterium CG11_big_fil_rev_8_21_14_0_20_64_10]